jgi:hypothetical protein
VTDVSLKLACYFRKIFGLKFTIRIKLNTKMYKYNISKVKKALTEVLFHSTLQVTYVLYRSLVEGLFDC